MECYPDIIMSVHSLIYNSGCKHHAESKVILMDLAC